MILRYRSCCIFFFNDTATTEIYTLSLHDALPILVSKTGELKTGTTELSNGMEKLAGGQRQLEEGSQEIQKGLQEDRKSTRLNSSHANISYAVFCLKKKN